jgi:hypothetical protein
LLKEAAKVGLLECIEEIVDPRLPTGVRHPVSAIVKAAILGLLAGYTRVEQIAHYIAGVWDDVSEPLGFTHWHPPDPGTYRLVLSKIPVEALGNAFQDWIAEILSGQSLDVSVDGKACRGLQQGEDPRDVFMMLNVFAHDVQLTLAQWRVGEKEGEPTVLSDHLPELLKRYPGIRLLVGDAYFSGRNLCEAITDLNRHYLVRIKGNHEDLEEALETWFQETLAQKHPPAATSRVEKRGA